MSDNLLDIYRPLLEAVAYAARAHRGQVRKDNETPYHSHVFRVCMIVRQVFAIDDHNVLQAALLHDTIEDSKIDYDDIEVHFGEQVADWVAALSKDKRQPETQRELTYGDRLVRAGWQVKVCKLADIFDNLVDSIHMTQEQRAKTLQRSRHYLEQLGIDLPEIARRPYELVKRLLHEVELVAKS